MVAMQFVLLWSTINKDQISMATYETYTNLASYDVAYDWWAV